LNIFHLPPFSSHLLGAMLLAAVLVAARRSTQRTAYGVLAGAFACGAFLRPELAVAGAVGLFVHGVWALNSRIGSSSPWTPRAVARVVVPYLPVSVLSLVFGDPLGSPRSFLAFSQHYAYGVARREQLDVDPWTNFRLITSRDFGEVTSIAGAFLRNPRALLTHVVHNLVEIPGCVLDVSTLKAEVTKVTPPLLQGLSAVVVVLALLVIGRAMGRDRWSSSQTQRLALLVFVGAAFSAVPGLALVFPRAHYLVVTCLFGWLFAVSLAAETVERHTRRFSRLRWTLVLGIVVFLVPAAGRAEPGPLDQREAASAVRELAIRPAPMLDLAGGAMLFAGFDYPQIDGWTKDVPWPAFVERHELGIVMTWNRFLMNRAYSGDAEFVRFLSDPTSFGFCELDVVHGQLRLFVRPALLDDAGRSHCRVP
jgi:hypothetical protein